MPHTVTSTQAQSIARLYTHTYFKIQGEITSTCNDGKYVVYISMVAHLLSDCEMTSICNDRKYVVYINMKAHLLSDLLMSLIRRHGYLIHIPRAMCSICVCKHLLKKYVQRKAILKKHD